MWEQSTKERIETLARDILAREGFELVEAKVNLRSRRRAVTLFIDSPEAPVSLNDCARISRLVEDALDREDLVDGRYVLEVSSPGLDRVLKGERDFVRFRGKRVRVVTRHPVDDRAFFEGVLGEVRDGTLTVTLDSGEEVHIPLVEVSTARLEVTL